MLKLVRFPNRTSFNMGRRKKPYTYCKQSLRPVQRYRNLQDFLERDLMVM